MILFAPKFDDRCTRYDKPQETMEDIKKIENDKLDELRPHPLDEEYNPPSQGGCWVCYRGNGWEETEKFEFTTEFDAFYHPECLEEFDVDSILEFEKMIMEKDNE